MRSVPGVNLALATWVSAINFWAWNMIGPLSTTYAGQMSLSSTEASLLVATPILVGALGRIVSGALTDRFGGRTMFIAVSLASVIPVLAVGAAGSARSYPLLLVCGLFLGIAGTIFAVGIPFANNWYDPARRGFATGVFGMGMVGTALSAFFTPRFVNWFGLHRIPDGVVFVYHAQERTIDVPRTETNGNRGGIHNSLTRLLIKPSHLAGGYAQTAYAFNYLGPTGNQRDEVTVVRRRSQEVTY